jgi:putative acetyltransferase
MATRRDRLSGASAVVETYFGGPDFGVSGRQQGQRPAIVIAAEVRRRAISRVRTGRSGDIRAHSVVPFVVASVVTAARPPVLAHGPPAAHDLRHAADPPRLAAAPRAPPPRTLAAPARRVRRGDRAKTPVALSDRTSEYSDMIANTVIRDERPDDADAIRRLVSMALASPQESILIDVLRARGQVVMSLVADLDRQVVGHAFFTPLTIETSPPGCRAAALAPLCVLPSFQNKGIGSRLVTEGIERCRTARVDVLAVLGDPKFYGRFGFTKAMNYGIGNEYGAKDHFMVIAFDASVLAGCSGLARYRSEFRVIGV